ncbi:MAG: prepilin-type N-terminal cleavage/methylation domain-containing protein [Pontiellaceae bacterium]
MKNKCIYNKKGLTLIEVLLSIVILSIGVSVLMVATSQCLSVIHNAKKQNIAQNLIHQLNAENPIDKENIEELSESGDFSDYNDFSWYRDIILMDEEERPGLYLINTRINWLNRGKDKTEEINYYIYAPNNEI